MAHLNPGDFALYDSTRCYRLRFDDQFEELVLKLPRSLVVDRLASPETATAVRIGGQNGLGRLAFDFVCGVAREADRLQPAESTAVTNNIVDLVCGAVAADSNTRRQGSSGTSSQLLRAKLVIMRSLRDSELSKPVIAKKLNISTRYLSKLFALDGQSFSGWVREQRLTRIAEDLAKPGFATRSISGVAYGWGMNSMPHFSRVFRQHFGVTPKQYRSEALTSLSSL